MSTDKAMELLDEIDELKQKLMAVEAVVEGVKGVDWRFYDSSQYKVNIDAILEIGEFQEDRSSSPITALIQSEAIYCLECDSCGEKALDEVHTIVADEAIKRMASYASERLDQFIDFDKLHSLFGEAAHEFNIAFNAELADAPAGTITPEKLEEVIEAKAAEAAEKNSKTEGQERSSKEVR